MLSTSMCGMRRVGDNGTVNIMMRSYDFETELFDYRSPCAVCVIGFHQNNYSLRLRWHQKHVLRLLRTYAVRIRAHNIKKYIG